MGIFSWLPTWIQSLIVTGDGQKESGISMMMLGMGGLTGGFLSGWLINAIGAEAIDAFMLCSLFGSCHFFYLKRILVFVGYLC